MIRLFTTGVLPAAGVVPGDGQPSFGAAPGPSSIALVLLPSSSINNGDDVPLGSEFEEAAETGIDLRITNPTGSGPLTLSAPVISAAVNCSVTVNPAPASPVSPGDLTEFTLNITPTSYGDFSFTMTIANNSPDNDPFVVNFDGTALAAALVGLDSLQVLSDPDTALDLDGNLIDAMLDQSGAGNDLTVFAGTRAARSTTHQLDGKNAIDCSSGDFFDYQTAAGVTQEDVFPSGDGTIMAIVEVQSYRNFFGEEDWIAGTAACAIGAFTMSVISGPKIRCRVTKSSGQVLDLVVSANTVYVVTMHWDNTIKLKAQLDNGTEAQNTSGGTFDSLTQARVQMLGNTAVSGGRLDGYVWELGMGDGDIGASAIAANKALWKARYPSLNV